MGEEQLQPDRGYGELSGEVLDGVAVAAKPSGNPEGDRDAQRHRGSQVGQSVQGGGVIGTHPHHAAT